MDGFKALFNFDNIGGKIKTFTKWYCWISIIIVWVACGILLLLGLSDIDLVGIYWGIAIPSAVFVPLTTWLSCWVLYGFGELIETNQNLLQSIDYRVVPAIRNVTREQNSNPVTVKASPAEAKKVSAPPAAKIEPKKAEPDEPAPTVVFSPTTLDELINAKNAGVITKEVFEQRLNSMYWSGKITETQYKNAQK